MNLVQVCAHGHLSFEYEPQVSCKQIIRTNHGVRVYCDAPMGLAISRRAYDRGEAVPVAPTTSK